MKEGITIGELHSGAGGNYEYVGFEALVFLSEPNGSGWVGSPRWINERSGRGSQPHDGVGERRMSGPCGTCHLDAYTYRRDLRAHAGAQHQHSDPGSLQRHGSAFLERLEQNAHHQIDVVCIIGPVVTRESLQMPKFR